MDPERRVPLFMLIKHKKILRQLASFNENVSRVNFTLTYGWKGKMYSADHCVDDYNPNIRACDILDVHHLALTDEVLLTEKQSSDYKIILDQLY